MVSQKILIKQEGQLEGKQELMRKLSNKFSIKQISEMLEIDISEVDENYAIFACTIQKI